jgi:hypothetical protein
MAQPALNHDPIDLPLNDVRTRLTALVRMTNLTGRVTVITDGGAPVAALVPADAARSRQEARADAARGGAAVRPDAARPDAARPDTARPDVTRAEAVRGSQNAAHHGEAAAARQEAAHEAEAVAARREAARQAEAVAARREAAHQAEIAAARQEAAAARQEVAAAQARIAETEAAAARASAAARGWQQRVEATRENLRAQHLREVQALEGALAQAWELIDRSGLPGRDRTTDYLRAQHRDLIHADDKNRLARGSGEAA